MAQGVSDADLMEFLESQTFDGDALDDVGQEDWDIVDEMEGEGTCARFPAAAVEWFEVWACA